MNIYIPLKKSCTIEIKNNKQLSSEDRGVFFNILNDGGTVKSFLEAIKDNNLEDAKGYLSKNFVDKIDLKAVTEVFEGGKIYKHIERNDFGKRSKIIKTNSVLIMEDGISMVLHLHMIQEPDRNGNWKIFGIEKE